MGKQINYYMGYEAFLPIAQAALDSGCIIYRHSFENGHWVLTAGTELDIVVPDHGNYYFHLPETGEVQISCVGGNQHISSESRLCVIEAGFSHCQTKEKRITSSRLYVMTGRYGADSEWIARAEALTKIYSKLVRIAKKIAPYGEISSYCANPRYAGDKITSKRYITSEYRLLVENEDYTLL